MDSRVKRMTHKTVKHDRKGLTLLEVLIAVFVLAIAALPLLNMFVYNTTLVRRNADAQDTTYTAQAVMEDLQPLGYGALYSLAPAQGVRANYQIKSVVNSSTVYVTKSVSIDRIPYGPFNNLVTGTASYAHLIIRSGTATFTCPDGNTHPGLSYSSGVSLTATTVTIGGNTYNLNKPAGTNLILIINAGTSAIASLTVTVNSAIPYVLYAYSPDDAVAQNITVNNTNANSKVYRKYNSTNDPPPSYMLVNAVCKVYRADNSVESIVQNTLKVNLP